MAGSRTSIGGLALLSFLGLAGVSGALAQADPPSKQSLEAPNGACDPKTVSEAATQPAPGSSDGTAPGSTGSTGWSGGIGGSFIGTTSAGAVAESETWQPPVARGIDLAMALPADTGAAARC